MIPRIRCSRSETTAESLITPTPARELNPRFA